jgi:hypothetical protein
MQITASIRRNRGWERALPRVIGFSGNRFSDLSKSLNHLPANSHYAEGIATIRFRDCIPVQIVQMEHAWYQLANGEIVDVMWREDEEGTTCYTPLRTAELSINAFGSGKNPVLLYNMFQSIPNKVFFKAMQETKRLALEEFDKYDSLMGEMNLWRSKAGKEKTRKG